MIEDATKRSSTEAIFKQQEDLITDLTNTAIQRCEHLCNDVENKVRSKGATYVTTLTSQLDENEQKRSNETFEFWKHMKKEIGDTYSKLTIMNSKVISNSNNLQTKLSMAKAHVNDIEVKIKSQQEKVTVLNDTVTSGNISKIIEEQHMNLSNLNTNISKRISSVKELESNEMRLYDDNKPEYHRRT